MKVKALVALAALVVFALPQGTAAQGSEPAYTRFGIIGIGQGQVLRLSLVSVLNTARLDVVA